MRTDRFNRFSDAQAITTSAASSSAYKFGAGAGKGRPLMIEFRVDTTFTTGAGATKIDVTLQSSSDNAATDAYANVADVPTLTLPIASLVAGNKFYMQIPPVAHEAYLQLYYTCDAAFNAGKLDAQIVEGLQTNLTH